jgi:hypothetical protein
MNRRMFGTLVVAIGALLVSASALAHHGRASLYDPNKEMTLKATITEFVWVNPHVQIGVEAVDVKGTRRQWLLEGGSTGVMANRGWSRKLLKPGDTVTVTFHPGLRGASTGELVKLVLADGRELETVQRP